MLTEVRVMLDQDMIDEVHKLGGSLQYAIEDGLRIWLYAALQKHHARTRRSLAAKRAKLTRKQQGYAKYIPTRDADSNDIFRPNIGVRFTMPFPKSNA